MYNAEQKTEFIKWYTLSETTAKNCVAFFDIIEPYEIEWGEDICTKSVEDVTPIIEKYCAFTRKKSSLFRVSMLKKYIKWCKHNNIKNTCEDMISVELPDGLDKIRNSMVSSPAHLQQHLNSIFTEESQETTENIYRCCFWLMFGGANVDDIVNVKCSDVDLENFVVHCKSKDVMIYREGYQAFKISSRNNQFRFISPKYTIWRDRVEGNELIRGIRDKPSIKSIRNNISRLTARQDKSNIKLSLDRAYLSGIFYRIFEREAMGIQADFEDVAINHMMVNEYKYIDDESYEKTKERVIKEYSDDYYRWKAAFYR